MTRAALAAVIVFSAAPHLASQSVPRNVPPSPSSAGAIRGRVVAADGGNPVRNALVDLFDDDSSVSPVFSDGEGRFELVMVPPGQHSIAVSKAGYARTVIGSRPPVDTALRIDVAAGKAVDGIEIQLRKSGTISGRVLDDFGEPMPLATVMAGRVVRVAGRVAVRRDATAETDEMGAYRLSGLPAAEFVVAIGGGRVFSPTGETAVPVGNRPPPHNYYPHASSADEAQPVPVAVGEEVAGIDLTTPLPPAFLAGPPPPPTAPTVTGGLIQGRVVRADGLPVRRARVRLSSGEQLFSPYDTMTDNDGRYEFRGLRPGAYLLAASSFGSRTVSFGQRGVSDRGELVIVKAGAVVDHIDMKLPRGAVISGRIVDEYGDPIENANVYVEQVRWSKGRRRLLKATWVASRLTNDLGRYRIFGVSPGRYMVGAAVVKPGLPGQVADVPGYARTYFPGTPVAGEAQSVEVDTGEDALNVDFALVRGRSARVAGTVYDAAGQPLDGAVSLSPSVRSGAIATATVRVRTSPDGTFEFPNLAPGEYVLQSSTARLDSATEGAFALRFVTVNGADVTGVTLRMTAGSTITGRVTFEGGDPPGLEELELSPVAADLDFVSLADNPPARAEVHDDGTFEMHGVNGPRRLRLLQAPEGWALKTIRVNGLEVTDAPLPFGTNEQSLRDVEVVLTSQVAEIAGRVTDARRGSMTRLMANG